MKFNIVFILKLLTLQIKFQFIQKFQIYKHFEILYIISIIFVFENDFHPILQICD